MTLYPRSRFLRNTIFLFCFALALIALDMIWVQVRRVIHPRYDTTRVIEPVMSDGSVDYLGAIENYFSRGVTPENNAVPLIFEALGRAALPRTQLTDGITSRLGMSHLPETGDYFALYADFTKARDGKAGDLEYDVADEAATRPSNSTPSASVVAWLAANEKPLAKIRQATTRTRYFIPFNGGNRPDLVISVLLPHIRPLQDVARGLLIRARSRATSGDISGSRDDAGTLHRLAWLMSQAPTLVERASAIATELRACDADRAVAATGKLSPRELQDYAAELGAMPDLENPTAAIDMGERFMMLDATQHLARMSPVESGKLYRGISNDGSAPPAWLFPFLPIPYEQSMIDANAWYDSLIVAFRQPTYAMRRDSLTRWEKGVNEASSRSNLGICSADWGLRLFMPALSRFQTKWETVRAEKRLTQVGILLTAYKLEHNTYPGSLAELSSDAPSKIPADNFTDRPFIYARTSTGYTLHSPGPNLTDDDGSGDDVVANGK